MRLGPKLVGDGNGVDTQPGPPPGFIGRPVQLAVMAPAERYGKFVAHLEPITAGLGEAQVMGITRLPGTDQAALLSDGRSPVGKASVCSP